MCFWQMDALHEPEAIKGILNTNHPDEHVADICCPKKPGPER